MWRIQSILGCSLLAIVAVSLAASGASAQSGIPEIPIGPDAVLMPSPDGLAEVAPTSPLPSWSGLALSPLGQPTWPLRFFVTHWMPRSRPVAVRELGGPELPVSRVTRGRLICR